MITDEWWLDVVEASNRVPATGAAVPETAAWGRWTFPLPHEHETAHGEARGLRLAWTAMQLRWVAEVEERPITQITPPNAVLAFIEEMPGLAVACMDYPELLAMYAPQITIPGFSGPFERAFSELAVRNVQALLLRRRPLDHDHAAHQFYSGGGIFSPSTSTFEPLDYTVWLYTDDCAWLPDLYRGALREGFHKLWSRGLVGPSDWEIYEDVLDAAKARPDHLPKEALARLGLLVSRSLEKMRIRSDAEAIAQKLVDQGFLRSAVSGRGA